MVDLVDIEARKDPNLRIQVYYVRLNALNELLGPLSRDLLHRAWEAAGSQAMAELHRSAIVGVLISDLIRALDLREISAGGIACGQWFVHSGVTHYTRRGSSRKKALISFDDGRSVVGVVRSDCEITGTADVNMDGDDDVSIVVGRLLSAIKFDLVVAGYRWPSLLTSDASTRTINLNNISGSVLDSINPEAHLRIPEIRYQGMSEATVLSAAVMDTFDRFKYAVEYQGAWKQLYDSGSKPAHESRHQMLFQLFANLSFKALGIKTLPSADHGSGPTDLTLVFRDAVQVVEFKKDYDLRRLVHGLTVQLPFYMRSADTRTGAYLAMCHERDPGEIRELLSVAKEKIETDVDIEIFIETVDCRPRKSASKA
jgi:hypothetical protein